MSSVTPLNAALQGDSLTFITPFGPGLASTYCLVAAWSGAVGADARVRRPDSEPPHIGIITPDICVSTCCLLVTLLKVLQGPLSM